MIYSNFFDFEKLFFFKLCVLIFLCSFCVLRTLTVKMFQILTFLSNSQIEELRIEYVTLLLAMSMFVVMIHVASLVMLLFCVFLLQRQRASDKRFSLSLVSPVTFSNASSDQHLSFSNFSMLGLAAMLSSTNQNVRQQWI